MDNGIKIWNAGFSIMGWTGNKYMEFASEGEYEEWMEDEEEE